MGAGHLPGNGQPRGQRADAPGAASPAGRLRLAGSQLLRRLGDRTVGQTDLEGAVGSPRNDRTGAGGRGADPA